MTRPVVPYRYVVQSSVDGTTWTDVRSTQTLEAAITEARESNLANTKKAGDIIHRVITASKGTEVYRRGWSRIEQANK